MFVADIGNNRVQRFAPNGEFRGSWGANGGDGTVRRRPGRVLSPFSIAVDAPGYIYVADALNNRVQKFVGDAGAGAAREAAPATPSG